MVIKTRVKDGPRLFCTPHRGTDNWHKLYNQRTGVERCPGRPKEHIGLDNLTLRDLAKVKTHAYLCAISLLATVTAVNSNRFITILFQLSLSTFFYLKIAPITSPISINHLSNHYSPKQHPNPAKQHLNKQKALQ